MDVIVISNGLGNQMSQYALYLKKRSLKQSVTFIFDERCQSIHNGFELKNVFGIDYNNGIIKKILFKFFRVLLAEKYIFISRPIIILLNLCGIKLIKENTNYDFNDNLLKAHKGICFYFGGWHSEKYFNSITSEVKSAFEMSFSADDNYNLNLVNMISSSNSVSIHIRRGDYMSKENYETFGSVCTKEYFEKAISLIHEKIENPVFFIFSNDFEWVKQHFNSNNIVHVDGNKGCNSWKDLLLISKCKHNINSNSTFSWWGAWLNPYETKIIITPEYFINNLQTNDLYPESWIKISKKQKQ